MRCLFSLGLVAALSVLPIVAGAQIGEDAMSPKEGAESSDATPKTAQGQSAEPESHAVDPELSPFDIHRWHPEAFDPSLKSKRELKLEYERPTEEPSRLSRGARIAIGVIVPVVVLGAVAGAVTAGSISRWEF